MALHCPGCAWLSSAIYVSIHFSRPPFVRLARASISFLRTVSCTRLIDGRAVYSSARQLMRLGRPIILGKSGLWKRAECEYLFCRDGSLHRRRSAICRWRHRLGIDTEEYKKRRKIHCQIEWRGRRGCGCSRSSATQKTGPMRKSCTSG